MGRRRLIEDDELLAIAREVFVEKGSAASTREIARRAGISETVIYQRLATKAHLFFAAMVPPALNPDDLLAEVPDDLGVPERLERIALGLMEHFREVVPILLRLMTHPEFDLEKFARGHPDSHFGGMHQALVRYLELERARGRVVADDVGAAALTIVTAVHSLALLERLGVHGGRFEDPVIRGMIRALWTGLAPRAE